MADQSVNDYLLDRPSAFSSGRDPILDQLLAGLDPAKGPAFTSLADGSGNLLDKYKLQAKPDIGFQSSLDQLSQKLGGINLNTQGLEEIRKRALATGPSDWANLQTQIQGINENQQMDNAATSNNSGTAKAYSDLATHGGLSSAARERVATKGARDLATGKMGVARQGSLDRLGIASTDETNKLDLLKSLPASEVSALQPELQKTSMWSNMSDTENARQQALGLANRDYSTGVDKANLSTLTGDVTAKNAAAQAKYEEQMKGWAADRQATATQNSGKK